MLCELLAQTARDVQVQDLFAPAILEAQARHSAFPIEAVIGICVPFLSFVIVGVTLIIAINKRKMQRDDMEATLKMEMIERGYSAEDIERTLAARIGSPRGGCNHRGKWKPAHENREPAPR
jgi:hypothetical protein